MSLFYLLSYIKPFSKVWECVKKITGGEFVGGASLPGGGGGEVCRGVSLSGGDFVRGEFAREWVDWHAFIITMIAIIYNITYYQSTTPRP